VSSTDVFTPGSPEAPPDEPAPLAGDPVEKPPGEGPQDPVDVDLTDEREIVQDEDSDEEKLVPKVSPVERKIGPDERGREHVYVQRELMWFGKIRLYGVLGRAVKIVMEGEGGLNLDDLLAMSKPKDMLDQILAHQPGADTAPDADDRNSSDVDATQMLAAFARVVSVSPDLLKEFYCIALGAKEGHWPWLMDWGLDTIDDEMGQDILETFIDQNWGAIGDFFGRELPKMAKRAAAAHKRASSTDRSKR
jgi:hypothetical protein